jgi:hypothetical protein
VSRCSNLNWSVCYFLQRKVFFVCSRSRRTVWGWKLPEMEWYRIMGKNKIII